MATLKVRIHQGRDLPVMDRATGLADPYVVVSLNSESYRTEIDTGTCNPVWNKDVRFDVANLLTLQEDPLKFQVWDHDIVTRDDLIGLLYVDLNSILALGTSELTGWFPLFDTCAGLRGELRITLKIKFHASENPAQPRVPERIVREPPHFPPPGMPQQHDSATFSSICAPGDSTAATVTAPTPSGGGGVGAGSEVERRTPIIAGGLLSPVLVYRISVDELQPIESVRSHAPSLTTEEEGVHIFSMSRLDPSVFRVEQVLPMVEELIVKADPEHSRFSTLRSSSATNELRMLQLFKLSGKVRRQLARKVLELHCNCVLGYREQFDLDPNGIIVRACGTPCVLSSVTLDDTRPSPPSPANLVLPPSAALVGPPGPMTMAAGAPSAAQTEKVTSTSAASELIDPLGNAGVGMTPFSTLDLADMANDSSSSPNYASFAPTLSAGKIVSASAGGGGCGAGTSLAGAPATLAAAAAAEMEFFAAQSLTKALPSIANTATVTTTTTTSRSQIVTLTMVDMPCGAIFHVGGLVAARSVKMISKLKSKLSISQERDMWWSELREEIKYNARLLHCNAIIDYHEVAFYDHEDVVVLSISGTAVVLDMSWLPLRCGPEHLYHRMQHRLLNGKHCSILHLYSSSGSSHHHQHHHHTQHRHHLQQDGSPGVLCTICKRRKVPEVLLGSCGIPLDMLTEGPPVLIQAIVSKTKPNVKGAELALCLSQAIPFLEFSLHKQLMFKMQLERMNAAFMIRVNFAVGSDVIVATLTATGFRVCGLPIPAPPKLRFLDVDRIPQDMVVRLQESVEAARKLRKMRRRQYSMATSKRLVAIESSVNDSASVAEAKSATLSQSQVRGPSSSDSEESVDAEDWVSSSSSVKSDDEETAFHTSRQRNRSDAAETVVTIDDEEEAELMLGMLSANTLPNAIRFDDVVTSVSYLPSEAHRYSSFHERLSLARRYSLRNSAAVDAEMTTSFFNRCFANARQCYLFQLRRLAVTRQRSLLDGVRVFHFRVECCFEPNSNDLLIVLDGIVCGAHEDTSPQSHTLVRLHQRSLEESEALLRNGAFDLPLPPFLSVSAPAAIEEDNPSSLGATQVVAPGELWSGATNELGFVSIASRPSAPTEQFAPMASSVAVPAVFGGSVSHLVSRAASIHEKRVSRNIAKRFIFAHANAPFSMPHAFSRASAAGTAAHVDPFELLQQRCAATGDESSETRSVDRFVTAEQAKRTGVIQRQLHALTSLASATLRNFADRVGFGSEVTTSRPQTTQDVGGGPAATAASRSAGGRSRTQAPREAAKSSASRQQLVQPCSRVPADRSSLLRYDDDIIVTPLDYVPGAGIVAYVSRISQHFIREADSVYSAAELGAFYMRTDVETSGIIKSLVKALGGNALLAHKMQLHEVWDSDGSGCAVLVLSITGHVAIVTRDTLSHMGAACGSYSS